MNPKDAMRGQKVDIYDTGEIVSIDLAEPVFKIRLTDSCSVYREVWFDSDKVEPAERPRQRVTTWRNIVADAILEGRDAEALHILGNKSQRAIPYIKALQELYREICKRNVNDLTAEERSLVTEVVRLANLPPPRKKQ